MLVKNDFHLDNLKSTKVFKSTIEKFSECLFIMKRKLTLCYHTWQSEAVARSCSVKKAEACNFIKKETVAQVFSCEFNEISTNIFSYRTPPMAALDSTLNILAKYILKEFSLVKIEAAIRLRKFLLISRMFQNNFLFRRLSNSNFSYNRSF